MPVDFSKIFSTDGAISAPTDTQYLQGFAFLGAAPPPRGLFNFLFQNIDQKLLALYLGSKLWKSSTAYAVGDIVFTSSFSFKYMQCTVAGTSGLTEPVWTAVGTTKNDGTATWLIRDFDTGITASLGASNTKLATNAFVKNAIDNLELIIDSGTGTGYYWRKWKSGKIEIFGSVAAVVGTPGTVTFPKPFDVELYINPITSLSGYSGALGMQLTKIMPSLTGFAYGWDSYNTSGLGANVSLNYHVVGR
jgi:hypothetical protein